jgi:hypothetical protein
VPSSRTTNRLLFNNANRQENVVVVYVVANQTMATQDDVIHQDLLTLGQMEAIRNDIATAQPMIGEQILPAVLLPDYTGNASFANFQDGINILSKSYRYMRKVRGDGNCFYRAFLFGYLESLLTMSTQDHERATSELSRMTAVVQGSMEELISVGYPEFAIDTFHEVSLLFVV